MKKNRKLLTGICITLVIIIAIILIFFSIHQSKVGPVDRNNVEPIYITVDSGDTWDVVLEELYNLGVISDYDTAYSYVLDTNPPLYKNTYVVNQSMDMETVINTVSSTSTNMSDYESYTVVVYEGASVVEIANAYEVNTGGLITSDDLLSLWSDEKYLKSLIDEYWFLTDEILNPAIKYPLEGYFTPATYVIGPTATAESVTTMMLDGTDAALKPYEGLIYPNGYTLHEILTLASIIERETITAEDKYIVSGVFYNRINTGMPLQSDITVLYALGEHKEIVTYEDLEVDSPYNTYMYSGLPPGPIASPSVTSIDAAINPQSNEYYYFFALQDTGEVIYSETYEEHMAVVEANPWE